MKKMTVVTAWDIEYPEDGPRFIVAIDESVDGLDDPTIQATAYKAFADAEFDVHPTNPEDWEVSGAGVAYRLSYYLVPLV